MRKFKVKIAFDECKGCERCINACTKSILKKGNKINIMGFHAVEAATDGCIGCCKCFYCCPEPGAITIVEEVQDVQ